MTGNPTAQTTVVIPVWDLYVGTDRLTDALASLQSQEIVGRIIVVDNASDVAFSHVAGVDVVRSPRRLTVGAARNFGLREVKTPYVVFWDADDVMLPGTLAFLEAGIRSAPELAAFATAILEDPFGARHRWPRRWIANLTSARSWFALLTSVWSLYPTTGATIMRTELVRDAGGYTDADSGEDWCLGVSLAFRGRLGWSERPGRLYRIHSGSVWARHMTVRHQLRHAAAVRTRIRADPGVPQWARACLPVIALGQYAAIAGHVGVAAGRRLSGGHVGRV